MRILNSKAILGTFFLIVGVLGLLTLVFPPVSNIQQRGRYIWGPTSDGPTVKRSSTSELRPISFDRAVELATQYVASIGNVDLGVREVMQFEKNFYFIVYEKSTGTGAFEMLIDPYGSWIRQEPGPNMMWNTKYGMMDGMGMNSMMGGYRRRNTPTANMPVTPEQAQKIATEFLKSYPPGVTTEEPDAFYGYYTIHLLKDGQVYGMLSVNGYTRQVWYHNWHGAFIAMRELH
jgi:hypothetical protein